MKNYKVLISTLLFVFAASAHAGDTKTEKEAAQIEANLNAPVNCSTAEADIRMLESEKAHTGEQVGKGITSIVPVGLVINLVQGDEDESLKIATGHYDRLIDDKIAKIKKECKKGKH